MALNLQPSFWKRFSLIEEDEGACIAALRASYSEYHIEEFGQQGYCSFTLLVSPHTATSSSTSSSDDASSYSTEFDSIIVQIRPAQHGLDHSIAQAAKTTYPLLAPSIWRLDLRLPSRICAYEMQRLHGTPLSRLLPQSLVLDQAVQRKQERLMKSFAAFIAQGWQRACTRRPNGRGVRADSPIDDEVDMLSQCTGKVGASINHRLEKLAKELPNRWLKEKAWNTLRWVQATTYYPVVLNHGDLIPSNILVDEQTWEITGLVDWAEAEYLPFGTCLYGLELLLGFPTPAAPPSSPLDEDTSDVNDALTFTYYAKAKHFRKRFWTCLLEDVPELKERQEDIMMMRDMGVLLWYGYAWDDGTINRVVNEMDDAEEVACLRAFLSVA